MREAFLKNYSQSKVSIPLFHRVPVVINGRALQNVQFVDMAPGDEHIVGRDISLAERKHYLQFKPIQIELEFRDIEEPVKVVEEPEVVSVDEPSQSEEVEKKPEYTEEGLMKKKQAELIKIATGLGLEATTQDSKAQITKKILEKVSLD